MQNLPCNRQVLLFGPNGFSFDCFRNRFDFLQTSSVFSLRVVFVHALSDFTSLSACFIRQIARYLPLKNKRICLENSSQIKER